MLKSEAINLLGGTVTAAAREIGITPSAVSQWIEDPAPLPQVVVDRVQAVLWRRLHMVQPPATAKVD